MQLASGSQCTMAPCVQQANQNVSHNPHVGLIPDLLMFTFHFPSVPLDTSMSSASLSSNTLRPDSALLTLCPRWLWILTACALFFFPREPIPESLANCSLCSAVLVLGFSAMLLTLQRHAHSSWGESYFYVKYSEGHFFIALVWFLSFFFQAFFWFRL